MSSDDCYSTDEKRRKKNTGDLAEIFTRSKKMMRTPERPSGKVDDKLDKILVMLQALTQEVQELKMEQMELKEEFRKMKKENESIKRENAELNREFKLINEKLDALEREKRRNNVVVHGLKMDSKDQNILKEEMEQFIKKELNIDTDIKSAKNIGNKICLIEFNSTTEKEKVMKNKSKLKNRKDARVYINDDMTKAEREIQGVIRKTAKEEINKGNNIKIGFLKLIVNNEVWKWDKEKGLLEKVKNKPKNL